MTILTKPNLFLEITTTNNCNCKCTYCFEGNHPNVQSDRKVEDRQIELIVDAANKFDKEKYTKLVVSFWGGEPFLNLDFILRIIEATCSYDFIGYHFYTNGTLTDKVKQFIALPCIDKIRDNIHMQLSYDGEPHHTIKRGDNSNKIFDTAELLISNKIKVSFKATLSYDMIEHLPEIWKSYYNLFLKYGDCVAYYPTFDSTAADDIENKLDVFKTVVQQIAYNEYKFVYRYRRHLWKWFSFNRKSNCDITNSIHMHTDGNIYVCHGAAYNCKNNNFKLGNIFDISSIYDILNVQVKKIDLPEACLKCAASHCQVCHIVNLNSDDDPHSEWSNCRVNNISKCKFYKQFGYIDKILQFKLATHGVMF